MDENKVLEFLCYHDKRNPISFGENKKNVECYCDNCFYNRTILAEEILRLLEIIKTKQP